MFILTSYIKPILDRIFPKEESRKIYINNNYLIYSPKNYYMYKYNGYIILSNYKKYPKNIFAMDYGEIIENFIDAYKKGNKRETLYQMMELDKQLSGKYIIIDPGKNIFRDPLGLQSLYYNGKNGIFSSNKKYIWLSGYSKSFDIPPNIIYNFSKESMKIIRKIFVYPRRAIKTKFSIDDLSNIFLDYVSLYINNLVENEYVKHVYIAFSGGVDSSFTAKISELTGLDITLVIAASEDSPDYNIKLDYIKKIYKKSDLIKIPINAETVNNDLNEIIEIVEEYSPVSISVAIPEYYIFRYIPGKNVFMGQGSDEMFGGYKKYVKNYNNAEILIRRDIIKSYKTNFEREDKLARNFNKKLYYPLITPATSILGILIPLKYKIRDNNDDIRKWIIRLAAKRIGLPKEIYLRKKHSLQYSTRSMDILRKIAKKQGLKTTQLLYKKYILIKNNFLKGKIAKTD